MEEFNEVRRKTITFSSPEILRHLENIPYNQLRRMSAGVNLGGKGKKKEIVSKLKVQLMKENSNSSQEIEENNNDNIDTYHDNDTGDAIIERVSKNDFDLT